MNILVLAATSFEIAPLLKWRESSKTKDSVDCLITGPGIFFTTLQVLQKIHDKSYDFIIHAGIAGAFPKDISIGSVFQVESECFADFGAMDHEKFLDIFSLGLLDPNQKPFQNGALINPYYYPRLPKAKSVTVNCASGNQEGIDRIQSLYHPDLESLEGAASTYICLSRNIPFIQIRSVSNRVEPRNRAAWNIPLAIENLNQSLIQLLEDFKQD